MDTGDGSGVMGCCMVWSKERERECMWYDTNLVESNTMGVCDIDRQGRVECIQHELSKVLKEVCATVFPRLCVVCALAMGVQLWQCDEHL